MGDTWVSKTRIPDVFRGFRPPLCTYIGYTGSEKPPEDGEINEMTLILSSTHRIRKVWGRARYLSVMEAPHNIESLRVRKEESFCFFETWRSELGSDLRSPIFQAGSFNHCTRAPAFVVNESLRKFNLNAIYQQIILGLLKLHKHQLQTS